MRPLLFSCLVIALFAGFCALSRPQAQNTLAVADVPSVSMGEVFRGY